MYLLQINGFPPWDLHNFSSRTSFLKNYEVENKTEQTARFAVKKSIHFCCSIQKKTELRTAYLEPTDFSPWELPNFDSRTSFLRNYEVENNSANRSF